MSDTSESHLHGAKAEAELARLKERIETRFGMKLAIPPRSFREMQASIVEIDGLRRIKIRFPYDERFANPIGSFQGGMLCTALDNTFGPLSYLAAKRPCVTTDLSTQFFRTFFPEDEWIEVEARVVSKSPAMLTMTADVRNLRGKLIAIATSSCLILNDDMLKRMTTKKGDLD